jgi:predicted DNA-binding transcriptional regulator AlpA
MSTPPSARGVHAFPPILSKKQAADLLGISLRSFEATRAQPWFPKAIAISDRVRRWSRDELLAAVVERAPRAEDVSEPASLAAARASRATAVIGA